MVDIEEVIIKNKNLTDDVIDTFREGYGEDIAELFLIQRSLVQEVKRLREGIKSLAENIPNVMTGKYMIDALMELIE